MRLELEDLAFAVLAWAAAAVLAAWLHVRGLSFRQAPTLWWAAGSLPIVGLLALLGVPLGVAAVPLFPAVLIDKLRDLVRPDPPTEDELHQQDMTDRLRRPRLPGRPPLPLPGDPPSPWGDRPEP